MKTLNSKWITKNLIEWTILLTLLTGCKSDAVTPAAEALNDQGQATERPAPATPTPKPSRTPLPSRTPVPTPEGACKDSGEPDTFKASGIPDILLKTDAAILGQTSLHTETDVYRFGSYGAASYGSETRLHYICQEDISSLTADPPNILSYCKFERETNSIHVLSGEVRGTPERIVNESLVQGRKAWVRQEGGSWHLSRELNESELSGMADAFRLAPFFSAERSDCQLEKDHPDATPLCFRVDIPGFLRSVYKEEISYVDCVSKNQGVIWIDPQTQLPKEWMISFSAAVLYPDQESNEFPYNVKIEMSQKYLAVNEHFDYPEP